MILQNNDGDDDASLCLTTITLKRFPWKKSEFRVYALACKTNDFSFSLNLMFTYSF